MKLYYAETPAPRKVCAVARYLDLPIDYVFVDLLKGEQTKSEYLAINPNGKVPVLVEGERKLWEADAIVCYFAQRTDSGLWPRDPQQQIEVVRWMSWNSQHLFRQAGALYYEYLVKAWVGIGAPDEAKVAEAQGLFRKNAAVLEQHLKGRKWLLGNDLSVADFLVGAMLPYAPRAAIPLNEFSEVQRWHDQLNAFDAWRKPFPERAGQAAWQA
ncbi:glutathione S-transferase family protein [Paraburkholderia sp. Ac-20336]|uniref:glutathione S-transferase family protein n=1 Tax=Paraburkholderia sp. Ac-20336 TaxID=2703886 RepID=UPI00197E7486|nr:glutathione S-transferase family protein [Paraburkholderia sp. Ac-20336]MBN3806417.1 glutathione S-transferase family protein [Paraburkholderia sp. Ac-20336]